MTVDISVLIGGEAGQGIQTVGLLMARTCHRAGLYVMAVNDFESRIRGGHSFIQLRISDRPVHGPARKLPLHGRALPIATGAKIANHHMTVLVSTGDGDCYGEGGNHFMQAIRRNIDVTVLAHNNGVYGLTKGQASPTSMEGMQTKMQPGGVITGAFNPLAVALSLGAGFVARGFSGEGDQLSNLIQAGIRHRGFALIDILQPCVSFNRVNTHKWYKDRIAPIEENHDETDLIAALRLALGTDDRIPTGIYHRRESPSYTDRIDKLNDKPLTDYRYRPELLKALLTDGYP
jgi:2-oxoglutarate ferredoxin oxidoreductase subunit beta